MKTLVISNEKGGVGKSTIAFHAAHYFAEKGRVLVIDLDQQQAALTEIMQAQASETPAIDMFAEPTVPVRRDGITLAARTQQLDAIEREDLTTMGEAFGASLAACAEHYDFVVIDCPPAYGVRCAAALIAADLTVAPIELQEASLAAVKNVVGTISAVHRHFKKPPPDFIRKRPLLVSRFNRHSARQRGLFQDLAEQVGRIVIDGAVVARDAYARIHAEGKPVWDMRDHRGQTSGAIKEAATEMRAVLAECERMMGAA